MLWSDHFAASHSPISPWPRSSTALQGTDARPRDHEARLVEATLSPGPVVDNEALLRRTLELYGQRSMDWSDAYLAALVDVRHLDGLVSFGRLDTRIADPRETRREP